MMINNLPIETDRLIINKTTIEDIDLILKLDKQEVTQKFLGGIKNKSREERIEFLKNKDNSFTVSLKDNTKIGFIGLDINKDNSGELSYIFDYDYSNRGYCTEACLKILDICKDLGLDYISAETVKGNNSSKRVLEKLGFLYQNEFIKDGIVFMNYKKKLA